MVKKLKKKILQKNKKVTISIIRELIKDIKDTLGLNEWTIYWGVDELVGPEGITIKGMCDGGNILYLTGTITLDESIFKEDIEECRRIITHEILHCLICNIRQKFSKEHASTIAYEMGERRTVLIGNEMLSMEELVVSTLTGAIMKLKKKD